MLRHQGGELVKAGFYLNLDSWEINTLQGPDGGILDGGDASQYLRIPVTLMLLFAPLMGAMFAVFLPFIGIYLVAQYLLGKGWIGVRHTARSMVVALGPSWHPAAAHLTGDEPKVRESKATETTDETGKALDELEKEIERRRS